MAQLLVFFLNFNSSYLCLIHTNVRVRGNAQLRARIPIGCCTQFSCVRGKIIKVRAHACRCARSIRTTKSCSGASEIEF